MGAAANKKTPNDTDAHVGGRIRLRRTMLGISQEKLGDHLGITFQQVQKYEKGANRVGASRLQAIAEVLGVPVSYFFEELPWHETHNHDAAAGSNFCTSAEGLQLNRAFVKIKDARIRRTIIDLIIGLGA